MGFMDKAKKMAEEAAAKGKVLADQAQTKLDEVQTNFNQQQQAGHQPPEAPVEYDKHGRPTGESAASPAGAGGPEASPAPAPAPAGEPAAPPAPPSTGSGLTSGDPLAG